MACRTPAQIRAFLEASMHRMDGPAQFMGDEPNSCQRSFEDARVTGLIAASWVYNAAAGNQSIPAVYACLNAADGVMCDRYYLPSTPRDLALFEKAGYPVFGVESKHQLADFDVVMTSISYPVLIMSFFKMLSMSDVPPRRSVREQAPEKYPFVLCGGQIYGDPECLAPIIDAMFLGEAEDEPGNPGIQAVFSRIADYKAAGLWATDRRECYARLAREFNFLYFPTFVDVEYGYEDRSFVGVGVDQADPDAAVVLSKQVVGYRSNLPGMRMPFLKRFVHNLDAIPPLAAPPLLYTDLGMGAGDLEVGRGCPAWCSFCALCVSGDTQVVTRTGVRQIDTLVGEQVEIWNERGWEKAEVQHFGQDKLNRITFAPAFLGWSHYAQDYVWKGTASKLRINQLATALHRWPLVDGGETHHLAPGDVVRSQFARADDQAEWLRGWVHGLTFGDGTRENSRIGDRSNSYAVLVRADQPEHLARFEELRCDKPRNHSGCSAIVCVNSITRVTDQNYRVRMWSQTALKSFPESTECSSSYVGGFIEGWDAADGNAVARSEDRRRINSQHPDAQDWLARNAAYGGWVLAGVFQRKSLETNYGTRKHPTKELALSRLTAWKVVSIEEEVIKGDVYCAMVSGDGFFTLASGVLTGNTYRQRPRSPTGNGVSGT